MDSMIHVGGKVDKDSSEALSRAISEILYKAHEYRTSEVIVLKALSLLGSVFDGGPTSVTNCTLTNRE